jgi:type IV secretion system protein VirB11
VCEISLNRPGRIWIERMGERGMCEHAVPELSADRIRLLAQQVAAFTDQAVSREHPLLSATLPRGERVQFVLPPASSEGAFSIRKQVVRDLSLEDYVREGALAHVRVGAAQGPSEGDRRLRGWLDTGAIDTFLREAVRAKKNILISGGTSSGKTTLLNALAKEIPAEERILTIEDARELQLAHPNRLSFVASKGDQGDAHVSAQELLEASLRMRPERILLGELRGKEAYSFLRAVNTGHPGSLSTLHADGPERAFEQLALMVLQAGLGLQRAEIVAYVRSAIDVVVQLHRGASGRPEVSEVYFGRA